MNTKNSHSVVPGCYSEGMPTRALASLLALILLLLTCFLIIWGMSAEYVCTGTGQDMSCSWSHSLIPGAQSPQTQHLETR